LHTSARIAAESNQAAPTVNPELQPGAGDKITKAAETAIKAVGLGLAAVIGIEAFGALQRSRART
jgi:hypothetical protein